MLSTILRPSTASTEASARYLPRSRSKSGTTMTIEAPRAGGTLGSIILGAIARHGDRPLMSDGTTSLTYRELGEKIGLYCSLFRSIGLAKGDGIGVLSTNRADVWPAVCAAHLMGIRFTPLHPMAAEEDHVFVATD